MFFEVSIKYPFGDTFIRSGQTTVFEYKRYGDIEKEKHFEIFLEKNVMKGKKEIKMNWLLKEVPFK